VRREAVATEPDTAVLAFGGPPTFEPAGHEYMACVRGAVDRPEEALAIAEAGLRELGETPGTLYAMALALAAAGRTEEAWRRLDEAIARVPALRDEARDDALLS
jgi:hypothetical protein